jgi:dTMP kinase
MTNPFTAPLRRFVVLEGGDGTGTTTQLSLLGRALAAAGVSTWITCEPTDGPEGLLIRRILSGELARDPGTLARLFAADRNEHLRGSGGILERLGRGDLVVCDRYVLSSLVYQGLACGPELAALLNADFPRPELLLYFDLKAEISMARLNARDNLDIFEDLPFQQKVRSAYEAALASYSEKGVRVSRIDASRGVDHVHRQVLAALESVAGRVLEPVGHDEE